MNIKSCGLLAVLLGLSIAEGTAATLVVTNLYSTVTNGYPTLRAAYAAAHNGDTIKVEAGPSSQFLESPGPFSPQKQVTIVPGPALETAIISVNTQPPNQSSSSATPLSGSSILLNVDSFSVTNGFLWWAWTASADCGAIISAGGDSLDVYTKSMGGGLVVLTNYAEFGDTKVLTPTSGTTYYVEVFSASGTVPLSIQTIDSASNDLFANRIPVYGTATSGVYCNMSATKEPGEPNHAGNPGGHSLWWEWTTPFTGPATVSLGPLNYVSLLAAYTGTNLSTLTAVANTQGSSSSGQYSNLTFFATAGTKYEIALDGRLDTNATVGESGTAVISFQQSSPVSLDGVFITNVVCHVASGFSSILGNASITNRGTTMSGPLRLNFFAVPCANPAAPQSVGTYIVSPSGLAPGQQATVPISTTISFPSSSSGADCWEYATALEEQFAGNWFQQSLDVNAVNSCLIVNCGDQACVAADSYYGKSGLDGGGPVIIESAISGTRWMPVTISNAVINVPRVLTEGASEQVSATVNFSNGTVDTFNSTDWAVFSPAFATISTNGLLQLGAVNTNEVLTITGQFEFAGATNTVSTQITISNLPPPVLTHEAMLAGPAIAFTVQGVPNRVHVIQTSTNLTAWTNLATQALDMNGQWRFTNAPGGSAHAHFYRVMEAIP